MIEQTRFLLPEEAIPTSWYNLAADLPHPPPPVLHPGTHQPIFDVSALLERKPDYVLLLAWNFKDEIAAQQQEYLAQGGRFIVPVPVPEILERP